MELANVEALQSQASEAAFALGAAFCYRNCDFRDGYCADIFGRLLRGTSQARLAGIWCSDVVDLDVHC
jgi:hypothetical protein